MAIMDTFDAFSPSLITLKIKKVIKMFEKRECKVTFEVGKIQRRFSSSY